MVTKTIARIKRNGKNFEVVVDLDEALKFKKNAPGANINSVLLSDVIFYNSKSGDRASGDDLEQSFETSDSIAVAEKIIKSGEVVKTAESMKKENDGKYKQVVDFLNKNAVSPEGRPYTPDRLMSALKDAHVNVKNKPVESQITEIIDALSKVLPLKIEVKKIKLIIPAQHTGKAYGLIKEFNKKENWMSNGDLEVFLEMPSGLVFDFYDKINNATLGSVLSEELK